MLALIAVPRPLSEQWKEQPPKDEQERADPAARIVELPGAHHYMFQNEEADVLREARAFLQTLH